MTITAIPTRAPSDLGAALTNARSPQTNELSAVNLEKIKDRVIEIFSEVGLSDGSTAGSVNERLANLEGGAGGQLLFSLDVTDTASVISASPSTGRGPANTPTTPTGVSAIATMADPAIPGGTALKVGGNSTTEGLLLYPIDLGAVTLPAAGYVLEVDVAQLPTEYTEGSGVIGVAYRTDDLGSGATPRGFFVEVYRGAGNVNLVTWRLETSDFTRYESIGYTTTGSIRQASEMGAGGLQIRIEVRRIQAQTPAQWMIRIEAKEAGGSVIGYGSFSGVATPADSDLDGKTFDKIGLGGCMFGATAPAWIAVRALRVLSLP